MLARDPLSKACSVGEGRDEHVGGRGVEAVPSAFHRVRTRDARDDGRTAYRFIKAGTGKIDRAIAAVLAYEAAMTMPRAGKPRVVSMADALRNAGEL